MPLHKRTLRRGNRYGTQTHERNFKRIATHLVKVILELPAERLAYPRVQIGAHRDLPS